MKLNTMVIAKPFPDIEQMGGAWKRYANKKAVTIYGCSNDDELQLIRFEDGHTVYWRKEFIEPSNLTPPSSPVARG